MAADMPAVAIENASLASERALRGTVATLPGMVERAAFTGPVLILIGEAVEDKHKEAAAFLKKSGAKNFCESGP
jgi:siroheme synthase